MNYCTQSRLRIARPAQPQLRLKHEQLSSLDGKGNCLGAHWDIVLPVLYSADDVSEDIHAFLHPLVMR
jgi:hypothetical protein